jgi:uncharacterized protein YndB with AHSA1/START domain
MAAGSTSPLSLVRRFAAPAPTLYAAWTHPALARQWLFATARCPLVHADIDARPGGALRLACVHRGTVIEHRGTFLHLEPAHALAFTLALPEAPLHATTVSVRIARCARGSVLSLAHAGVPAACADVVEGRWLGALYGLAETLAGLRDSHMRATGAVAADAG